MQGGGLSLWISQKRTLYPPALKFFGIDPDRVIFIDVKNEKDLLWMTEEALKCQALCAVIAEIKDLDLTASRRLQLAVEHSRVTGLLHRINPRTLGQYRLRSPVENLAGCKRAGRGHAGNGFFPLGCAAFESP